MFHMKRRDFLVLSLSTTGWLLAQPVSQPPRQLSQNIYRTLQKVQHHIAPPLATNLVNINNLTDFLESTIYHHTYDRDIRAFVIEGAQKLLEREGEKLFTYDHVKMEKMLRMYEEEGFGSRWLSRIMILTLEGMLGDPVYGVNTGSIAWRALGEPTSYPQPKERYIFS